MGRYIHKTLNRREIQLYKEKSEHALHFRMMLAPDKNGESEKIQKLYSVQKLRSESLNKKTLLSQFRSYYFRIWNFMTSDNFYKWKRLSYLYTQLYHS